MLSHNITKTNVDTVMTAIERLPIEFQVITLKDGSLKESEKTSVVGAENKKLFPTDIGVVVTNFLVDNFQDIVVRIIYC